MKMSKCKNYFKKKETIPEFYYLEKKKYKITQKQKQGQPITFYKKQKKKKKMPKFQEKTKIQ